MATKLSIDGVIFSGKGEILDWDDIPITTHIKFDFGGDNIFIIEGSQGFAKLPDMPNGWNGNYSSNPLFLAIHEAWIYNPIQACSNYAGGYPQGVSYGLRNGAYFYRRNYTINFCLSVFQSNPNGIYFFDTEEPLGNQKPTVFSGGFEAGAVLANGWSLDGEYIQVTSQNHWLFWTNANPKINMFESSNPPIITEIQSCGLVVNYADGSQSPILEFPQCPQDVFLVDDEDQVCQNACNLANSIINKLG